MLPGGYVEQKYESDSPAAPQTAYDWIITYHMYEKKTNMRIRGWILIKAALRFFCSASGFDISSRPECPSAGAANVGAVGAFRSTGWRRSARNNVLLCMVYLHAHFVRGLESTYVQSIVIRFFSTGHHSWLHTTRIRAASGARTRRPAPPERMSETIAVSWRT